MTLIIPIDEVGPDEVWRGRFRGVLFDGEPPALASTTGEWVAISSAPAGRRGRGYVLLAEPRLDVLNIAIEWAPETEQEAGDHEE